jgi:hypothetical protein
MLTARPITLPQIRLVVLLPYRERARTDAGAATLPVCNLPARVPLPTRGPRSGLRLPPVVIALAVRWTCTSLSCRDVAELPAERGIEVDHVTVYRWVQRVHAVAQVA